MTKEEILRKRNLDLIKEIAELKAQIVTQESVAQHAQKVIAENLSIRNELLEALNQAYEFRDKYKELVKEMQGFKKSVKGRNAIERWVFDLKRK